MNHDVLLVLVVTIVFLAGIAFELAGLTLDGWHTISYYAFQYPPIRAAVLLAIAFGAWLWYWHTGQVPSR